MTTLADSRTATRAPRPSLRSLLDLRNSRRALARLDVAALNDVGLTRTEARADAARAFWDTSPALRRRIR